MRLAVLVLIALPLLVAPASVATSPLLVTVPEHRAGDRATVHVEQEVSFPWDGRTYTFHNEGEHEEEYALTTLPLRWGDVHEVLTVSSKHPWVIGTYERIAAYSLATGEQVLAPDGAFGWRASGSFSLLGVYEQESVSQGGYFFSEYSNAPATRLPQIVGGDPLAAGDVRVLEVDHRPRFDLVERFTLVAEGEDAVGTTPVLRARLTAEAFRETAWEPAGIGLTLWLADGSPEPLRVVAADSAPGFSYRLERTLLSFEAGPIPIPWGSGSAPLEAPSSPIERASPTVDGLADGASCSLALCLSEAVAFARSPLSTPAFIAWLQSHPAAVVVEGSYSVSADEVGPYARWMLEFADDDSTAGLMVTLREPVVGVRVRSAEDGFSFARPIDPELFEAVAPVLTVEAVVALASIYAIEDAEVTSFGFGFYERAGTLVPWVTTSSEKTVSDAHEESVEPSAATFRDERTSAGNIVYFAGETGEAESRAAFEGFAMSRFAWRLPQDADLALPP